MLTNKQYLRAIYPFFYFLGFLLLFPMCASNAQKNQQEGIQFLHIKFRQDGITLIESSITAGQLKAPRRLPQRPGIHYEVIGKSDIVIWKDAIENPLRQRVEYVDEEGQLQSKFVEKAEAEVFIRIPYHADASMVRFYLVDETGGELQKENTQQKYLGSIQLR